MLWMQRTTQKGKSSAVLAVVSRIRSTSNTKAALIDVIRLNCKSSPSLAHGATSAAAVGEAGSTGKAQVQQMNQDLGIKLD